MSKRSWLGLSIATAMLPILIAGCAPRTTVVLLPEPDGSKTAVAVTQNDRLVVLDEPYAAVRTDLGGPSTYRSSPEEVRQQAGPALDALPPRTRIFVLYFVVGKEELTEESKATIEEVFAEIAKRRVTDIVIVGHTDLTGTDQLNDALGQRRADFVKKQLVDRKIVAEESIQAISRGKREPAKQSSTAEALNRRVEIKVR